MHNFRCVITRAHNRIASQFRGMSQHEVKGFGAGLFAQLSKQRDIAAQDGLQARANGPEDRARTHHDPAHHAERAHHSKTIQFELRSHHSVRDCRSWSCVIYCHSVGPFVVHKSLFNLHQPASFKPARPLNVALRSF